MEGALSTHAPPHAVGLALPRRWADLAKSAREAAMSAKGRLRSAIPPCCARARSHQPHLASSALLHSGRVAPPWLWRMLNAPLSDASSRSAQDSEELLQGLPGRHGPADGHPARSDGAASHFRRQRRQRGQSGRRPAAAGGDGGCSRGRRRHGGGKSIPGNSSAAAGTARATTTAATSAEGVWRPLRPVELAAERRVAVMRGGGGGGSQPPLQHAARTLLLLPPPALPAAAGIHHHVARTL